MTSEKTSEANYGMADPISALQDRYRMEQKKPLARTVVTAEISGAKLSANVSPCSWLYPGYPFQICVTMAGGGDVCIIDKDLVFANAQVSDIERLLAAVKVQKCSCRGCTRLAFDTSTVTTNREGKCEQCFLDHLNAAIAKDQAKEAKKIARLDNQYKLRGFTHRVDAWIHPQHGDDEQVSVWMVNATPEKVTEYLREQGSTDLTDYRIIPLA